MKNVYCLAAGMLCTFWATITGWNLHLQTLIIFMAIDYITGLLVAGIFKKSNKTKDGALDSRAGFKGLIRKGMMLVIVFVAYHMDKVIDSSIIMNCCIFAFIANETISIIENAGLMGIPIPSVITKAIEILKERSEE